MLVFCYAIIILSPTSSRISLGGSASVMMISTLSSGIRLNGAVWQNFVWTARNTRFPESRQTACLKKFSDGEVVSTIIPASFTPWEEKKAKSKLNLDIVGVGLKLAARGITPNALFGKQKCHLNAIGDDRDRSVGRDILRNIQCGS